MPIVGSAEVLILADDRQFQKSVRDGMKPGLAAAEQDVKASAGRAGDAYAAEMAAGGTKAGADTEKAVKGGLDKTADDADKAGKDTGRRYASSILGAVQSALSATGIPVPGIGEAKEKIDEEGAHATTTMGKIQSAGKTITGVVAVTGGAVAYESLKSVESYQSAVEKMAASGNLSQAQANAIGQSFLHMGSNTVYSAQQTMQAYGGVAGQLSTLNGYTGKAAQAQEFMATAGDLAEASQTDLGTATSTLANVMQTYGLNLDQARGASVDLFNASRLTGVGVGDLGTSYSRLHGILGAATPSISDSSAMLVELKEHGMSGRQAMQALGSMYTSLVNPTAAATAEQKKLGVSFKDSHGNLLPFNQIIAEVGPKIAGMGDAQAAATLKAMGFGSASLKILDIVKAGPAAYDKAKAAVDDQAAAHKALADQQGTLQHQLEATKVQVEDMGVSIGLKLMPVVKDILKGFSDFLGFLEHHKDALYAFAAVVGTVMATAIAAYVYSVGVKAVNATKDMISGIGKLGGKLMDLIPGFGETAAAEDAMALSEDGMAASAGAADVALAPIAVTVGLIVAALAVLGIAVYELVTHWSTVWGFIKRVAEDAWHFLDHVFHVIWDGIKTGIRDVINFLKAWWPLIVGIFFGPIGIVVGLFVKFHKQILEFVERIWSDVVGFFKRMWSDVVGIVTGLWHDVTGFFGHVYSDVTGCVTHLVDDVVGFFTKLPGRIVSAITGIGKDITGVFTGIADWVYNNVIQPIINFFTKLPGEIISALGNIGSTVEHAVTGAVKKVPVVGGVLSKILPWEEGGLVPGTGPQLAVIHGGEYIIPRGDVAKLNTAMGGRHLAAIAGALGGGGGGPGGAGGGATTNSHNQVTGVQNMNFYTPMSPANVANEVGWLFRTAGVAGGFRTVM